MNKGDWGNTPTPVTGVGRPIYPQHGSVPQIQMAPMYSSAINVQSEKSSVPVGSIHVPLPAMIAVLVFMLGGVISMTLVWSASTNPAMHLEPDVVTQGGGVAYKNEVKNVRQDFRDALLSEHRATRKMLLQMTLRCRRATGGSDLDCTVSYLYEPD